MDRFNQQRQTPAQPSNRLADALSLAQKAANGDPRGFIDQLIQNNQTVTLPDGRSMYVKDLASMAEGKTAQQLLSQLGLS